MNDLCRVITSFGWNIKLGKHVPPLSGWFARVSKVDEEPCTTLGINSWASSGHGDTPKKALREAYSIALGTGKATPSKSFRKN